MKIFGKIFIALNVFMIGQAIGSIQNDTSTDSSSKKHSRSSDFENEETINDLTSIVGLLADRVKALEETSRSDEETILNLEDIILNLVTKVEELEETVKEDREKISSLENVVRAVEQRNLQMFGVTERPPLGTIIGSAAAANVCMPRYVNNRCIFGGTPDIVAFRFENATFFNDDVEFNENVGFDEDADCMPVYNSTSRQCVMNNNFIYEGGTHQYQSGTKVTYRSKEVWMRPKKTFFRSTDTSFQGGSLEIRNDVDYSVAE